ncbi:MAG: RagB/SusD family nutrient uptake outer membrane protein [Prevotellaceae bacterium]|nr:RagB/SusD family nutrient uptake outer membrane protein [Prevotellaceae bacterium]
MKTKILLFAFISLVFFSSCEKLLDRPPLTTQDDEQYWTTETELRLYLNQCYSNYFVGYATLWSTIYTPMTGYLTNDDIMVNGIQRALEITVPTSRTVDYSASPSALAWIESYNGPNWNFYWVRKLNILLDRIEQRMGGILTEEQKNHWVGVGRFFRGMEYANLVRVFGDVPYYNREILDSELDELYKPRTPRNEVMDAVYDDLKFAFENVRLSDGDQQVNRYVVAAYIARLALYEGTWLKYHYSSNERAKKFLQLAIEAGDYVIASGKYDIVTDFRSLFGSENLAGNADCILYRHYSQDVEITHSIATYCNLNESLNPCANLDLVKAFICADGKPWATSTLTNANKFDLQNLIKTRDPRFEATFWEKPTTKATSSGLYTVKFIDREGPVMASEGRSLPSKYISSTNTNDYPVMRYAELLLNWIEAKAELATLGGAPVTQGDIETSINKIRNRPLDATAAGKGVVKTSPMQLSAITENFDPNRDQGVPPLLWEIRRERRMELYFEHSRLIDLRRWHKLDYMNDQQNPDLLKGIWVDLRTELTTAELDGNVNKIGVVLENGTRVLYDGKATTVATGYFYGSNVQPRRAFWDLSGVNPYLAPVGDAQRRDYRNKGYELSQTEGWSNALD